MSSLTRRRLLAGVGTAAATAVAGCSGITGPVRFGADAATVSDAARSATGYDPYRTTAPVVTRTYGAFGVEKRVSVTNSVAEYDRAIDLGLLGLGRHRAAVFAVLSTPQVELFGKTFNPVADMTPADLAMELQQRYESVRNLRRDGTFTASVLGSETAVTRFAGEATLGETGGAVDAFVYVGEPVVDGDDFVVPLAVHPRSLDDGDEVRRLLRGIRHG